MSLLLSSHATFVAVTFFIVTFLFCRTYFVVASRMVRPSALYRVSVSVLKTRQPLTVRASIQRNGVEVSHDRKNITIGVPEVLLMRVSFLISIKRTEPNLTY